MNYDVVIKSHEKDFSKLKYVIDSFKYLNPLPENIYIISESGFTPRCNFSDIIVPIKDKDVFPTIDKNKILYRYNWCWVNIVSLTQEFTKNDLYFDVQADNFFLKELDLFHNSKPKLFKTNHNLNNNFRWDPYFDFSKNIFDIDKITLGSSYITEFIMYDRLKLNKLWEKFDSKDHAITTMYDNINANSYPADQEIYGNMMEKYYSDCYTPEKVELAYKGDFRAPFKKEIEKYINFSSNKNYVACSYHTYWVPNGKE